MTKPYKVWLIDKDVNSQYSTLKYNTQAKEIALSKIKVQTDLSPPTIQTAQVPVGTDSCS